MVGLGVFSTDGLGPPVAPYGTALILHGNLWPGKTHNGDKPCGSFQCDLGVYLIDGFQVGGVKYSIC
ncbi:hypothetical protein CENSYa_0210 [Cenarchaeum symbiosum A]|uniref:Uncharacterized protein n=1 Tax=Cenarchaeum symbiosum (strain A) TaxID=414004 RepID=A0RU36_CENSY|nr:hypothetical protein CENSYa_0210 [Cenarchaeum symbiosum A]